MKFYTNAKTDRTKYWDVKWRRQPAELQARMYAYISSNLLGVTQKALFSRFKLEGRLNCRRAVLELVYEDKVQIAVKKRYHQENMGVYWTTIYYAL